MNFVNAPWNVDFSKECVGGFIFFPGHQTLFSDKLMHIKKSVMRQNTGFHRSSMNFDCS